MAEDVKDSVMQKTQKLLGRHITKPTLTPKLLKKPPFRFLHDIVTAVVKETGFLKGVFGEEEMVSENVKEREAKIVFLTKLIGAISAIGGNELDVKPGKIVAGLEATKTNKLLQALGSCLDKKLDSTEYVKKLGPGEKPEKKGKRPSDAGKTSKTHKDPPAGDGNRKSEKAAPKTKAPKEKVSSRASTDSTRRETKTKPGKTGEKEKPKKALKSKDIPGDVKDIETTPATPKGASEERKAADTEVIEEVKEASVENQAVTDTEPKEGEEARVEEESTAIPREISANARPRSAKMQLDNVQSNKTDSFAGQVNFLRPPSVRPSSARPGAPRLRPDSAMPTDQLIPLGNINVIVEDYNGQDDEETVVVESAEPPREQPSVEDALDIPHERGHLVEQILEQISDADDFAPAKGENAVSDVVHGRDAAEKDVRQLQDLVQTLTRVANPLGKLMNYLHEDLDGMQSELAMWMDMKKRAYGEIRRRREEQDASGAALRQQLRDAEESIKKVEAEIAYVQSTVLRNDVRIKRLLAR